MTIRIIIFLGITLYFLWDYRKDKKDFKPFIFPIIGIVFFASTDYYVNLDSRIRMIFFIVALLLTIYYLFKYYKDFKIERFREKKRVRSQREQERMLRDEMLLNEILKAKSESLGTNSSSYEITMNLSSRYEIEGQMKLFDDDDHLPRYEEFYEDEIESEPTVYENLENQIGMFEDE